MFLFGCKWCHNLNILLLGAMKIEIFFDNWYHLQHKFLIFFQTFSIWKSRIWSQDGQINFQAFDKASWNVENAWRPTFDTTFSCNTPTSSTSKLKNYETLSMFQKQAHKFNEKKEKMKVKTNGEEGKRKRKGCCGLVSFKCVVWIS
jgi:hypothetical protein